MTAPVPLRQVANLRLALPSHHQWVTALDWVPASPTELHLTSRYFPVVIRLSGSRPSLGLLLDERYLARPLVDQAGTWQGAYMPMALRCFPFHAPVIDKDPLQDITIAPDCGYLVNAGGHPLVENGQPSKMVSEIHRLFRLMRDGQEILTIAVDRLMIAELLVPLALPESEIPVGDTATFYTVDRARFSQLAPKVLAAMARQNFLSMDIAVACMFSQQLLKRDCLAKPAEAGKSAGQSTAAPPPLSDFVGIADFSLALDDGDLISLDDIYAMRAGFSVPAETAPEEAEPIAAARADSAKQAIAPDRDTSDTVPDIGRLLREAAAKLNRDVKPLLAAERAAPGRAPAPTEIVPRGAPAERKPPPVERKPDETKPPAFERTPLPPLPASPRPPPVTARPPTPPAPPAGEPRRLADRAPMLRAAQEPLSPRIAPPSRGIPPEPPRASRPLEPESPRASTSERVARIAEPARPAPRPPDESPPRPAPRPETRPADRPAPPTRAPSPARPPAGEAVARKSEKPPEISELIRKLDNLQKLLRLD